MAGAAPLELGQLLCAGDSTSKEAAWDELIIHHTRLLVAVARSFGAGHDEAMERYSYILEKLRDDDFRRLRSFDPDSGARFSTWLTVTARRLCLDYHRSLYGRKRDNGSHDDEPLRALRRALVGSLASDIDVDLLPDVRDSSAMTQTVLKERDAALRAELTRLTSRERLLLALRFKDDLSAARIAQIVGASSPFHVYRQLNSILERLADSLRSRGIEGSDG
jgi:RNA polymerase sigma factor (sigma-70 family)